MVHDEAKRTHQWLKTYARTPLEQGELNKRYLRYIASWDSPLDLTDPGNDPDNQPLAYHISRSGAASIGRKSFLYRTPGSPLYLKDSLLDEVLQGLRSFHDKLDQEGRFIFGRGDYYKLGSHEAVWRLEPLIWSRLWLDEYLAKRDKQWIDHMIRQSSQYLLDVPRVDLSNQGIIWCYGCWLAGLYLKQNKYIHAAEQYSTVILHAMIDEKGQIKEASDRYYRGGGPCSNYTYTGWTYVMLYRLLSGRSDLDERLLSALRWSTHYVTDGGLPRVPAASVRRYRTRVAVADMLHGYAFYAHREPVFQRIIQRILPECESASRGHALHPAIWAANAHQKVKTPEADPSWLEHFEEDYDNPPCQYALVSRRYQTGITLRGLFPAKGLQTFAYRHEPAIIHAADVLASTVQCDNVDIAAQNIDAGPFGWEVHIRRHEPRTLGETPARLSSITTRRQHVWECYLFTESSVIYVVGTNANSPIHGRWVLHDTDKERVTLDRSARCLNLADRKARIHYLTGRPKVSTVDGHRVFELSASRGPLVIGFGSSDLAFESLHRNKKLLHFKDATGRYVLGYRSILTDDGQYLRRWWGNIVQYA